MANKKFRPLPPLSANDIKRYREKIQFGERGQCWPWIPSLQNKKHGMFGIGRKVYLAHRVGFFAATGIDPLAQRVCHKCDYPPCQNPDHMFLGTQANNVADMISKGRKVQLRGSDHPRARLTWEQVEDIRRRYRRGRQLKINRHLGSFALAQEFGITVTQLLVIVRGEQWKRQSDKLLSAKQG